MSSRSRRTSSSLGRLSFLVKHGPNAGSTFLIENDVTSAGRNPESDVFLDDITVSRKHAEIRRQEDGFFIHDPAA